MKTRDQIIQYTRRFFHTDLSGVPILEFSSDEQQQYVWMEWVPLLEEWEWDTVLEENKLSDALLLFYQMEQRTKDEWVKGEKPIVGLRVHHISSVQAMIDYLQGVQELLRK